MRSSFNGRGRPKSVSFVPPPGEKEPRDVCDREIHNQVDSDDIRTVKLLPDANMTISVQNVFRNTKHSLRSHDGHINVKNNNFKEDSNFNSNIERNNQYSNRGFERGRGRGRPRGFYHSHQSGGYDAEYGYNAYDGNQREFRSRPLSGSYENDGHYYGRQYPDNYTREYIQPAPRNYRARQSSGSYDTENYNDNNIQEKQVNNRNFRGRSKSMSDRPRRGRGGRGPGRGRTSKEDEDGNKVPQSEDVDENKEKKPENSVNKDENNKEKPMYGDIKPDTKTDNEETKPEESVPEKEVEETTSEDKEKVCDPVEVVHQ